VRHVVSGFYSAMIYILAENSFAIRLLMYRAGAWLDEIRRFVMRLFSTEREAYNFYKAYENAARETVHAFCGARSRLAILYYCSVHQAVRSVSQGLGLSVPVSL